MSLGLCLPWQPLLSAPEPPSALWSKPGGTRAASLAFCGAVQGAGLELPEQSPSLELSLGNSSPISSPELLPCVRLNPLSPLHPQPCSEVHCSWETFLFHEWRGHRNNYFYVNCDAVLLLVPSRGCDLYKRNSNGAEGFMLTANNVIQPNVQSCL